MHIYRGVALPVSLVALLFMATMALQQGPIDTDWEEVFGILKQESLSGGSAIIWQIRLPRVLMTLLVGASLAIGGAVLQGLFRNPLADPGLIGVSSGAALGAGLAIVFGTLWFTSVPVWLVPISAFLFGLFVTYIVYLIASRRGGASVATLLLAGVAMQSLAAACMGLLSYLADDQQLRDLTFWSLGSFGASSWRKTETAALFLVPGIICLIFLSQHLNTLLLGESEAKHLGVDVDRLKKYCIVLVSLVVGVSVASVGVIGFVGLVVPHMIRLAFGSDHRFLLPASASLGALVMVIADTLARNIISPAELPIGIITALVGCPFFLFLILKQRNLSFY